ncbi:ribonuclease BN-like family protein [Bifidobacterium leontopitheci]|uniref:Ribonuclease BN-like family protein n=2 Tax=Bifidobacterium leontopitheci TaxID=2650774 RepID=A0A6I1GIX0_9BIFI|nr:ribonuclease BN-like family protein [Bifidobacterium leontopitheci]
MAAIWRRSLPGRILDRYTTHRGPLLANGLAYGLLFAFFGGVWIAVSVFGLVFTGNADLRRLLADALRSVVPGVDSLLTDAALSSMSITFTWTGLATLLLLWWTVTGWMNSLRNAVTAMFDEPEPGVRETGVREAGSRETDDRDTDVRETGVREADGRVRSDGRGRFRPDRRRGSVSGHGRGRPDSSTTPGSALGGLKPAARRRTSRPPAPPAIVTSRLADTLAAAAVAVLFILSTVAGTISSGIARALLHLLGIPDDSLPGALVLELTGFASGLLLNFGLFLLLLRVVAHVNAGRFMLVGSGLGALALAVMQLLGARLLRGASRNPLLAPFAGVIGVLIWFNLVAQIIMLVAAFIAECRASRKPGRRSVPGAVRQPDRRAAA